MVKHFFKFSNIRSNISQLTHTIRFRLTVWYAVVLGILLLLLGSGVYLVLSNSLHSSLDDLLHSRAQQLLGDYSLDSGQFIAHDQEDGTTDLVVAGEIWLLVDQQGKVIQQSGKLGNIDANQLIQQTMANKKDLYESFKISQSATTTGRLDYRFYFTPVIENGQPAGSLILGRSRETVEETLHRLLLILLLATPTAILLSAGGGYWLATRAMRPVRTITQTASEIEESDLSRRLNFKSHNDELGILAATFDRMIDRLESAFIRQRRFTADASHELRTPLTIIDLEVNRILSRPRTVQEYQQTLQIIQSENNYMSQLVRDLLTLARADAKQTTFLTHKIDLSDLSLEVIERLLPLAHEKQIELYTEELPELFITGNQTYLTQMLTNLIENAIKYTSGIGNWVRVNVGSRDKKYAFIQVSDNGPGIGAEHLPHLFERFYRVNQARSRAVPEFDFDFKPEASNNTLPPTHPISGSGLGLSIVEWVVASHKGEIKVESHLGTGTTFEVQFPLLSPLLETNPEN